MRETSHSFSSPQRSTQQLAPVPPGLQPQPPGAAGPRGAFPRRQGQGGSRGRAAAAVPEEASAGSGTPAVPATVESPPGTVAPWRMRVHDARRRAFLVVRTALRFR